MANNTLDISMDQGSSLTHIFNIKNADLSAFDLTDFDARLQVRRSYGATTTEINGTLANSKLVKVSAINGTLSLVLTPADTSGIKFVNKDDETLDCVYDLEIQNTISGKVYKPAKGAFVISREVTR
jgi:hypothetical protein